MRVKRLFRTIVEYGFALSASAGACGAPAQPVLRPREGVSPGRDPRDFERVTPVARHPCESATCSVSGRVLEADGTPVSRATVVLQWDGNVTVVRDDTVVPDASVVTDESGHYSVELTGYRGGAIQIAVRSADGREASEALNGVIRPITMNLALPPNTHAK